MGHENIIKYCKRPFSSIQEMDNVIVNNINNKVLKNDRLFVLGDFCHWNIDPKFYLDKINCKNLILIQGNHDKYKWLRSFPESYCYYELKTFVNDSEKLIILFHYPIREWNGWHRGSYHLFGHVHQQIPDDPNNYSLDVGVDGHNFSPLSLTEIGEIMSKKTWKSPFDQWEKEGRLYKKDRKPEEELDHKND